MRQIILDTETTGLSTDQKHRVIEIGCLEMIDRRLTGDYLHLYLNPERPIERAASEVHGITEAFLADKPVFKSIAATLMEYIGGAELVIHNAAFDVGFLNYEFKLTKQKFPLIEERCPIVDTLAIARRKHPGQQNSLDALCKRYHVDNSNRHYHGALLDAELLAQVYLLMTGGQSQLFNTSGYSEVVEPVVIARINQNRPNLKILCADEQEVQTHEDYLQFIKESAGHCLWTDK